jgi:hypothetical protein
MMSRHFNQRELRAQIVLAAEFIRARLTEYDYDGRFTLKIEIEGTADKRDAKLTFNFDLARNYGTAVHSPNLDDAVNEMIRRMGFDKLHQAELLTYDADEAEKLAELQTPIPAPPAR